ncbi:hypothetical protein NC653_001021 [Populus alba x Populus x berolinensis]|uniref:Uncharacterized protein n=1 Tax=Populus alba x Populus x berolinensis TaxID=444605 RepID=A0AAD6WFI0_9ROSI|nr:hypothetical protein NC653_001021 [Populus alba x Populus x berolinensis]
MLSKGSQSCSPVLGDQNPTHPALTKTEEGDWSGLQACGVYGSQRIANQIGLHMGNRNIKRSPIIAQKHC